MLERAVNAAEERLDQARASIDLLKKFPFSEKLARSAWLQFLLASNGVYSKLEQGSKNSNQSRSWFGSKKHERKTDELLRYLHQARNFEEHSIGDTYIYKKMEARIVANGGGIKTMTDPDGTVRHLAALDATILKAIPILPEFNLLPVRDGRSGKTFYPPLRHKNHFLYPNTGPDKISKYMIAHLDEMITEARTYIVE